MEGEVLYQKYRPKSLDEVIGNAAVVEALKTQLSGGKPMPRAILLHGPTGCGKTTLARIIATELGAKGADLREIDVADYRGIDTIREIRRQIRFKPMESPCQVWILDEVHRLTGDAQSALLKTLEDTPEHVYFILCTTDPQKLLPTIRGRCAQYEVQLLTEKQMKKLLKRVVKAEGEILSDEVYDQIISEAQGHPRNALQILAQVLAVSEDRRLEVAKQAAEVRSQIIDLCRALIAGKSWKTVAGILEGLKQEDPESVRRAILGYCQTVLLRSGDIRTAAIMEEMEDNLFDSGFPGLVLRCYRILHGEE